MSINKMFNNWVSKNFRGLSAHTLCQLIGMEYMLPWDYINNMVYVDLFNVFTKNATEKEQDSYYTVLRMVENCSWL